MTLKAEYDWLLPFTQSLIIEAEKLTLQEAVDIINKEGYEDVAQIKPENLVRASSRLLTNRGYTYRGLADIDLYKHWIPIFRTSENEAMVCISLPVETIVTSFIMNDNFLDLQLIPEELARKFQTPHKNTQDYLLKGGFGMIVEQKDGKKTFFQTPFRALTFKPYGTLDYEVDERIKKEIESGIS
jgi:hypothetical protein